MTMNMNMNTNEMTNKNVKVMKNGVALCPVCKKFFGLRKLTAEQMADVNKHGMCPHCVETHVNNGNSAVEENKEVMLMSNENTANENVAAAVVKTKRVRKAKPEIEVPAELSEKVDALVKNVENISAFKRIKSVLLSRDFTAEALEKLQDKSFTQKATGVAYQFLLKTNADMARDAQISRYGKTRYSVKPVELNGEQYYITNDIYDRNVKRLAVLLMTI